MPAFTEQMLNDQETGDVGGAGRTTLWREGSRMSQSVLVQIFGVPIACKEGMKDS
jgi:hypothetical protein